MVLDDICRAVGGGDDLLDEKPAVVKVGMRRGRRDLLHAPVEVVVAVGARPPVKPDSMINIRHFLARMIKFSFPIDQMNLKIHICIHSQLPPP